MSAAQKDADKRLRAAKGSYGRAVMTATRGLARAQAHADWLRDPKMADFTTPEAIAEAQAKASTLCSTLALLVLAAPAGEFTPAQIAAARRSL